MALETVCCLCFMVTAVGGVFEIVNNLLVSNLLDRAARAVAIDASLQEGPADTEAQLLDRAMAAIRGEVGERFDPDLLEIKINVHRNPSTMLQGQVSDGENAGLGGDGGDMVLVRLRLRSETLLGQLRQEFQSEEFAFHALAVARNERLVGLESQ